MNKLLLIVSAFLFSHSSLATIKPVDVKSNACDNDYYTSVTSLKDQCLRLVSPDKPKTNAKELVIYLHGDYGIGGASYLSEIASHFPSPNRMNIAIIRPGYYDDNGNFSTGNSLGMSSTKIYAGRVDNYTRENIDIIADAILHLKKHYQSERVYLVGHSGGGAIAALISNFHPELVDKLLLINAPCDVKKWRPDWERSLSPIEHIRNISPKAQIDILSGAADDVVLPEYCKNYAQALSKINNNTKFYIGIDMKHNMSDESTKKLVLEHLEQFLKE